MNTPESFAFPGDREPFNRVMTAAARAYRINRWSRALHHWIVNSGLPSRERILDFNAPEDLQAVDAVYRSLDKIEFDNNAGNCHHAWLCAKHWFSNSAPLFLHADGECILDLFVAVGLAVRTEPDGWHGPVVYEYPQAPAEEVQAP